MYLIISISSISFMAYWILVQQIFSKMYPLSCLMLIMASRMVRNTKIWIPQKVKRFLICASNGTLWRFLHTFIILYWRCPLEIIARKKIMVKSATKRLYRFCNFCVWEKLICVMWTSSAVQYESKWSYPANIYLFKVNDRNTRKICDICS